MRAVQVQPHAEQTITRKQERTTTGLLLGQSWDPTRVYVLAAVPTPPLPKREADGSGWSPAEWFQEHARQVRRMLVGGVELIGMYVTDAPAERLADSALREMVYGLPLSACSVDRVLLRSAGGKALSGESYSASKKDAAAKPKPLSNIKVASVSSSLVTLESTLLVDVSVPVQASATGGALKQQLRKGLESFNASVLAAQASINGSTLDDATVLEKVFETDATTAAAYGNKGSKARGKTSRKPAAAAAATAASASAADADGGDDRSAHQVELFLRPTLLPAPSSSSEGVVRIRGACHCRVYAHSRSTVAQALLALKHDVISSLQARLQLVAEDSEDALGAFDLPAALGDAAGAAAASASPLSFTWSMPRRLFQPLAPPAAVCDYLLASEGPADGVHRIQEMLGEHCLSEAQAADNAQAFTREAAAAAAGTDAEPAEGALAGIQAVAANAVHAVAGELLPGGTTQTSEAQSGNPLFLPVAFGVLVVSLSIAFFTQVM